jgi:hypothetical protein
MLILHLQRDCVVIIKMFKPQIISYGEALQINENNQFRLFLFLMA